LHGHQNRLAFPVAFQLHRHIVKVVCRVGLLLPAIGIEVLPKVTLLVQHSHSDQWHSKVTGCLQVITREDAKATGIDRKCLRKAIFH